MPRTIVTRIQKRFSDVDSFLHVNNVSQQMYFDLGKCDYYDTVLGVEGVFDRMRIITAATHTSYLGQIRFEDPIYVTTTVERIGTKSITLLQRLCCAREGTEAEVRTESRSVMVAFDFERQESVPVPAEWRERMLGE